MHNCSKHNCIILKDGVNDPGLALTGKVGLGPFWTWVQVLRYVHVRQLFVGTFVSERPIQRTREGGSEWEPIKILLEVDENSNKTNAASNTCLRLTIKVGQAHVATGVPLDLGTNTPPSDPRNAAEKPNLESTDPHRSDR
jgi:hypothetical protein